MRSSHSAPVRASSRLPLSVILLGVIIALVVISLLFSTLYTSPSSVVHNEHSQHSLTELRETALDYDFTVDESRLCSALDVDAFFNAFRKAQSHCQPFSFPRPTSRIYMTGVANHGAGVGHQFGEWLYGPYLAVAYNITYVSTGFLKNGERWSEWLGFGYGEDIEEDVIADSAIGGTKLEQWTDKDQYATNSILAEKWTQDKYDAHLKTNQQRIAFITNNTSSSVSPCHAPNTKPLTIDGTTSSRVVTSYPHISELDYSTLLTTYRVHIQWPFTRYSCQPQVNLLLRQKYCFARLRWPVPLDLYADDRKAGRMIVAVHLRCGDSCFDEFRTTSFDSVRHSIRLMQDALSKEFGAIAFHIYSQPPIRVQGKPIHLPTAEEHFRPLYAHAQLNDTLIRLHFDTDAHITLHHLVQADILMGSQSSFSWIAFLLHHTTSFGPMPVCKWRVNYDKNSGDINVTQLITFVRESRHDVPRFTSLQDCYNLRPLIDEDYQQSILQLL